MESAITDSGFLFRRSKVFLWDDGFGVVSKNFEEITNDRSLPASRSTSDSKMINDNAEDLVLVREMNAMGLPASFKTNKNQVRKESRRSRHRSTVAKSELINDTSDHNVYTKAETLKSCSLVGTKFYVKGVEWGVFWDDFYAKSYYYNYDTQESTWFPPQEMEDYNLIQDDQFIEESSVTEIYLNPCPDNAVFENLHEEVEQMVLSGEDFLDSRSTCASSEICFQEEGTDLMAVSDASDNHQYGGIRVKRIRSNRKRVAGERKGQSPTSEMEGISPLLGKYWCQRYFLFSKFDLGVKIDEEGWFSVTPEAIARHQASRCGSYEFVVDAFSGVGGNTIQLAMNAGHVLAIDIDPKKVEYGKHNAELYGVGNVVEFLVGDFFRISPRLKADVVFLSPPWGGPDYIKVPTYDIHTMLKPHGGKYLLETAGRIAPQVIMFLPKNVDPLQLADLAALFDPPWELEVENNYLNGRLKGVTAYFSRPWHRKLESPLEGEARERKNI